MSERQEGENCRKKKKKKKKKVRLEYVQTLKEEGGSVHVYV